MKILISWGHHGAMVPRTQQMLGMFRRAGYEITDINHREFLGENRTYSSAELSERYRNNYEPLARLYATVRQRSRDYDAFMVLYDNVYIPEYLRSLDGIYKVYFCDDDPEGSEVRSRPYVRAFDYSFAAAVNFDAKTRAWQKYIDWGARRAGWYPAAFGIAPDDYDRELTGEVIEAEERPLDVVFIGAADPCKVERILEFRRLVNMDIYGSGWSRYLNRKGAPRSLPSRVIASLVRAPQDVFKLPPERLVPTYRATKIGFNIHESYGPCNRRMYSLAANGVMQICDCPESINEVFESGREVAVYRSVTEAAELVRYYLQNDRERRAVARAAFERAMRDYLCVPAFEKVVAAVGDAMRADRAVQVERSL